VTRILHLSDPHFGAVDNQAAAAFLKVAAALAPDLTILSGDLTMRARRSEMADAARFVAQLPQPRLIIPGNHDIPLINQPFDRFFRSFKRYQAHFGDDLEPELISNELHVIAVNSTRAFGFHPDWSEGRLSQHQLESIGQRFRDGPADHRRLLVLHHPIIELQVFGRAAVKPLEALMRELESARVDLVMCGHFHRSQVLSAGLTDQWKSIISQAPTVCSNRLQGEPQGFHEIQLTALRIEVIHHAFNRGTFIPAGNFAFTLGAHGWSSAMSTQ
jgi:3',5'-cyclic AMP phosphodiesterase CpdA